MPYLFPLSSIILDESIYPRKGIDNSPPGIFQEHTALFCGERKGQTGWYHTHIIQALMSFQRFSAGVVSAMQKRNILGVTSRYVIILNQHEVG